MCDGAKGWALDTARLDSEVCALATQIRQKPELFDTAYIRSRYERAGGDVYCQQQDPLAPVVVVPILAALESRTPFSAIRLGDGEMNILSYGRYANSVNIDRLSVRKTVHSCPDRFEINHLWATVLRDLMNNAVRAADLVGVLGLWRATDMALTDRVEMHASTLVDNVRGRSGHWRGMDYGLRLAEQGTFAGKKIGSAHFYFAAAMHIDELVLAAESVRLVTNRPNVIERMIAAYPNQAVKGILLRAQSRGTGELSPAPDFLTEVEAQFEDDMSGTLCLIGAGIWSEFYCTWVKERGGVAVDIGSAFDLFDGQITRPVHRNLMASTGLNVTSFTI